MAFSSNWSQPTNSNHQHHHHEHQLHENGSIVSGHGLLSHQLPPLQANPNPNHHHHVAASGGLPARMGGSMAERARQAKIHPPEGPIKCPRCDSSNTKFCYYNNYNLTQPRHFCKGCRRYWTQGGALRNVPVGGGCRKNNKKGKNGTSKSSSSSSKQSLTVNAPSPSSGQLRTNHQFPFSPTLYNLTQLGGIGLNLAANNGNNQTHQIGSSLMNDLGFLHVGNGRNTTAQITGNIHDNNNNNNNNNNENNLMTSVGSLSHFALFDPTTGLYAFQNEGNIGNNVEVSCSSTSMVDSRVYQAPPVKMEEQPNLANLTRPVSGLTSPGNQTNQYFWAGSDFSGPSNELL